MSAAANAIRDFLAPVLPGWEIQFGRWEDKLTAGLRYAVVKPAGGGSAELVRRPQFTLSLIGINAADRTLTSDAADEIIEAMRAGSGRLVNLIPAEPAFMATDDGRPVFELALSAITT